MLTVVICCDVDHDILGYNIPATRFDVYKEKLGWKSINNIEKAREVSNSVEDSVSNSAKITWFVRSDEQLKTIFDDYAYPLRTFWNLWKRLERQGDEIGWHPHLWRWSNGHKCWYQETVDNNWISHCLENGYKNFLKITKNLTSVRMGWSFHNNFTMRRINDLGLTVDLSASPGLRREGGPDERGSHFLNEYDWSTTPQKPYFPSIIDYRRPKKGKEKNLKILEIPITTAPKSVSRIFVQKSLRATPTNLRRKTLKEAHAQFKSVQHRYVANITGPYFKKLAKQKFKKGKRDSKTSTNLIAMFHPIELFRPKAFMSLKNNLRALAELSKQQNVPFRFLTATEKARELLSCLST